MTNWLPLVLTVVLVDIVDSDATNRCGEVVNPVLDGRWYAQFELLIRIQAVTEPAATPSADHTAEPHCTKRIVAGSAVGGFVESGNAEMT
jgi:hypothetical protein